MKSAWIRYVTGTVFLAAVSIWAACGGSTVEEEGTGQKANTSKGDSNGSSSSSSSGQVDACGPEAVDQSNDCEVCIASVCTQEAYACCQHDGCLDVVYCGAAKGCNGIECYAPDMCQAEIDAAGIDVAMDFAQALGDCAIANCPAECEDMVGG